MPNSIRVAGTWRTVTSNYIRVAGTWRTVQESFIRVAGTWRSAYTNESPIYVSAMNLYVCPITFYVEPRTWSGAKSHAASLVYGGRSNWRLPTRTEGRTLCENHKTLLESNWVSGWSTGWHWTSETPDGGTNAWFFYFSDCSTGYWTANHETGRWICVS